MDEITAEQLRQMFDSVGLEPSQAEIDSMLHKVQQYAQSIQTLRSAGLESEELGGVFNPHWPAN